MDQETAYKVLMGFCGRLRIKGWMQKNIAGTWDVVIEPKGHNRRTLLDVDTARAYYKELARELAATA